ncbi:MAG: hypothetical protein COB37_08575 [Kordiimonadales bacterium]|nr:MAG: hypothetical protein COB37_08575 [Kordiimonadales bacterium]
MEFLLVSGARVSELGGLLQDACKKAPRLAPIDGPLSHTSLSGLYIAGCKPEIDASSVLFWDGHGMADGSVFSSGTCLRPKGETLSSYVGAVTEGHAATDLRGVFSILQYSETTAEFSLTLDPLSQYSVFILVHDGTLVASNNIYMVERVAALLGKTLKRSALVGCFEIGCATGASTRSGYEDVLTLDRGQMIVGCGSQWSIGTSLYKDPFEGKSYSWLLEKSADRLIEYMAALAHVSSEENLLFDLTGGHDSRVCFAAAIGAGLENINIFVAGDANSEDVQIAHFLAAEFGAKKGNYPANFVEEELDFSELARRATFRQQGHATMFHYSLGTARLNSVLRVRGDAGEIMRSPLAPFEPINFCFQAPRRFLRKLSRGEPAYRESLRQYWLGFYSKKRRTAAGWSYRVAQRISRKKGLFTARFIRLALRSLFRDFLKYARSSVSMGMDQYMHDRVRRHFAFMTGTMNRSYGAFEPLFDPCLAAAASALSWEERESSKFVFDLIEKMAGRRMLEIPFADASLREKAKRQLAKHLGCSLPVLSEYGPLPPLDLPAAKSPSAVGIRFRQSNDSPIGLSWDGNYLWQNRKYLRRLATELSESHKCWTFLKRASVLKIIACDEYFYRSDKATAEGVRFLHLFIWLSFDECPVGVSLLIEKVKRGNCYSSPR